MRKILFLSAGVAALSFTLCASPAHAAGAPAATRAAKARVSARTLKGPDSQHLQGHIQGMESTILHWTGSKYNPSQPGDTPAMRLVPAPTSKLRLSTVRGADLSNEFNHDGHAIMKVSGLGKQGAADFHLLMPVSGHVNEGGMTKNETAHHFAKTNKYNIQITHPNGKVDRIENIASTGLVTAEQLGLHLQKGVTRVQFYPAGSAGVGGFWTGRTVDLQWDGE